MARRILLWALAALVVAAIALAVAYAWDMRRAYARVSQGGEVFASPYGDIEYAEGGEGAPVLVIHGSGGGFDQGELIAEAVLGDGFHWIAPSRFGYLRSTIPPDATWDDQADAYAALLDHLGVERVAVVAMSHGGPSALMFAARHPDRVSSLTLISCGVTPVTTPDQAQANRRGELLTSIFKLDPPYWLVSKLFKRQFMELIGASRDVVAGLSVPQRRLIERLIDEMNPASLRAAGVAFDNATPLPGARIAAIAAPTLIFHARDDALQLYENAEFAAATIPNARLVSFDRGGHVVLALEQDRIRAAARKHILDNAADSAR